MKMKKTIEVARVLGFTACCALLNSCGDDSSSVASGNNGETTCVGVGSPALAVQVDRNGGPQWTALTANGSYSDHTNDSVFNLSQNCNGSENDFTFKLVNSGTGCLTKTGTAVTLTKTTSTNNPSNEFTVVTQPSLPIAPGSSAEFKVRLASSSCTLAGRVWDASAPSGWSETHERFSLTVNSNDPTNPTFNSSIDVFGQS
ncbi:hypothetical protein SHI21_06330 [Bacteriovorax sp. PP10]|uniref:Lipoprotein n=1 Tax=Bacteriovorax antarcticus TaxID=3088717 RepID=A0ABU5VRY1_9BACT|nr:hypothetical protein [Bacteriovorax sp. PP10]MEA9355807.1 hypothetical protein [Bacteriovorax sp. PP10]